MRSAYVLLLIALSCASDTLAETRPDTTLGPLHFNAPAGWTRVEQPGVTNSIGYLSPDSTAEHPCLLAVAISEPVVGGLDLHKGLEAAAITALRGFQFTLPKPDELLDEQGYLALMFRVMAHDASGTPFFAYFFAADFDNRLAIVCLIDRSNAMGFEERKAAYDRVLGTYIVGDGSPRAGAPLALGTPPLTQEAVDRSASRIEASFNLKLTPAQRVLVRKHLQKFWRDEPFFRPSYLIRLDMWHQKTKQGGRVGVQEALRSRAELLLEFCRRSDEPLAQSVLDSYTGRAAASPAAEGARQLSPGDTERYAAFASWALGLRFSPLQLQQLARVMQEDCAQPEYISQAVHNAIRMWNAASRLSDADRALMACYYREPYLRQITYSVLSSTEQFLKKSYEEQFPPLAAGAISLHEPPLTGDLTDAYAELICFQANAVIGKSAFNVTAATKDAAARGLIAGYADFSGRAKYALAAMPQMLAEMKLAWPMLSDEDRRAWRDEWAKWFAPIAATDVSTAEALLERATKKERSDDEQWKKTPQAGMWETIRLRAVAQRDQAAQNTFINAMRDRYGDAFEARYGNAGPGW